MNSQITASLTTLTSLSRGGWLHDTESGALAPERDDDPVKYESEKQSKGYHEHETYNAWTQCSELLTQRDRENVDAWTDEVDSLLTFSGLLLTVVTLFIGTASQSLQPDNAASTVALLRTISQQLRNAATVTAVVSDDDSEAFDPSRQDIVITSLLSGSLLLSLCASGMGLWVKEWLREYSLDLPYRARDLVRVREWRHHGLAKWRMRNIVASISMMLTLAVTLFGIGVMLMTWKLNKILSYVLAGFLVLWTAMTWASVVIPTFSTHCPFKSPLARLAYRAYHLRFPHRRDGTWRWNKPESMVDRERRMAEKQGQQLELSALKYVNDEFWGDGRLRSINQCFNDVEHPARAQQCIEDIITARIWGNLPRNRNMLRKTPKDKGVLDLLEIWGSKRRERGEWVGGTDVDELWKQFVARVCTPPGRESGEGVV